MPQIAITVTAVIGSYLLGSVPTGLILSRAFSKRDPRQEGSGNIGATNVSRIMGKKFGILTLAGDLLKGFLPVFLVSSSLPSTTLTCLAGFAAFLGHLFPVYLGFKGGKGVATALGIFLFLAPGVIAIEIIIFIATVALWRYVSLGSLVATSLMPVLLLLFRYPFPVIFLSSTIAFFIFIKHRSNIKRLFNGTENKIK